MKRYRIEWTETRTGSDVITAQDEEVAINAWHTRYGDPVALTEFQVTELDGELVEVVL